MGGIWIIQNSSGAAVLRPSHGPLVAAAWRFGRLRY